MVMGGGVFQHHQPRQGCGVLQGTSDSVQITFLVFGECAETRPFVGRRPTRPHTPSGIPYAIHGRHRARVPATDGHVKL